MTRYTTYENTRNRHVTIHRGCDCRQIMKRGGVHQYNQGRYLLHPTYAAAVAYAEGTGLEPVKNCPSCKPT